MATESSHVWVEDGEGHEPDGPCTPDGPAWWDRVQYWRCAACGRREHTAFFRLDPERPQDPEEAFPPNAAGCDPDLSAVYEVMVA